MGITEMVLEQAKNEGIDIAKEQIVKNLLLAKRFTYAQITNFSSVTEKFVIKVRRTLAEQFLYTPKKLKAPIRGLLY